jgi:CheY-like chemotaxis protein
MTTILLVGGERDLVTLMRWLLEGEGYAVVAAADGDVAVAEMRRRPEAAVALLLSARSQANGLAVLEAAQADPAVGRHGVVLMTAIPRHLPVRWRELVEALAVPVLAKPCAADLLLRTLGEVVAGFSPAAGRCGDGHDAE